MNQIVFEDKMELLLKAGRVNDAAELTGEELLQLSKLLNMDNLFLNFPERMIRKYRDAYSGQYIQGMQINRAASGEVCSFSFIPAGQATRAQIYEGFIFSIINPAARNLTQILFWLNTSDYARMSISSAAGWGYLSKTLMKVKDWSRHLEIVTNPGPIIAPMLGHSDTTDLSVLNSLIYSQIQPPLMMSNLDRNYYEHFELI